MNNETENDVIEGEDEAKSPYFDSKICVVKLDGDTVDEGLTYLKGICETGERQVYLSTKLDPGDYIIFAEIDWPQIVVTDNN